MCCLVHLVSQALEIHAGGVQTCSSLDPCKVSQRLLHSVNASRSSWKQAFFIYGLKTITSLTKDDNDNDFVHPVKVLNGETTSQVQLGGSDEDELEDEEEVLRRHFAS